MKTMIRSLGTALLVGSLIGMPGTGFAQGVSSGGPPAGPATGRIAILLAGASVSNRELGREAARGLPNDLYGSVSSNTDTGSAGGPITTTNSINGNSGITTVFQNTGNNSLFQSQTIINVTIH